MNSNEKQKEYWTNSAGNLWVKDKSEKDNMLEPLGNYALSKFNIIEGMNILDIGCGTGKTTTQLAKKIGNSGHVLGLDLSETMINEARKYSDKDKTSNIDFLVQDVQNEKLKNLEYDAAFSRFGVMFFSDPIMAFKNIYSSLKNDGLLTFICWQNQKENPWYNSGLEIVKKYVDIAVTEKNSPGPFAYANKNYIQEILIGSEFKDIKFYSLEIDIELFKGFTLDSAVKDYLDTTPIFKENVLLLNSIDKKNLFLEIKNIWYKNFKDKYLLFPSKTWVICCKKY
ncbi:class I SAM-dependent methyltransferase [Alphaproteobacteria bacterium]|nr:class I SAM-dependent methyltransferase [Alphaproteobacteria bacterium]